MTAVGTLRKMHTELDQPIRYRLVVGTEQLALNPLLGETLRLRFTGTILCTACGRTTRKSYGQGYCYPCFRDGPESSPCIIRPELCEAHQGGGRDPDWEARHHLRPHVVYLAVASGLKVGVTRDDQIPTRWIDQGAWQAIRLSETPQRQWAGQIEVALKEHVSDRTHWQKMLRNVRANDVNLPAEKKRLGALLSTELQEFLSTDDAVTELEYPVHEYPIKVKSLSFDRMDTIEGTLLGIKGQYLLFDGGRVLNIRKHRGYEVEVTTPTG